MTNTPLHIREVVADDLHELIQLYKHLNDTDPPADEDRLAAAWQQILTDPNHHIFVGCIDERLVSSCVLVSVPNLTRNASPYAFIENVVTHADYRKRGYASQLLQHALSTAWDIGCYKVMLLTGSKLESTLRFYDNAGFDRNEKTAFIARPVK